MAIHLVQTTDTTEERPNEPSTPNGSVAAAVRSLRDAITVVASVIAIAAAMGCLFEYWAQISWLLSWGGHRWSAFGTAVIAATSTIASHQFVQSNSPGPRAQHYARIALVCSLLVWILATLVLLDGYELNRWLARTEEASNLWFLDAALLSTFGLTVFVGCLRDTH